MPYFDHSATTPLHPNVEKIMGEVSRLNFGNPSSIYSSGRKSKSIIESTRRIIAEAIGAEKEEIVFTGSGTESNNMVLWSLIFGEKKHVITSAIEHPAILKVIDSLASFNIESSILPVDSNGRVNPDDLKSVIKSNTGLISIMTVNNEVGTIQPIEELTKISKEENIPFHSDTVQAFGKMPLSVNSLGAEYLSFSAHKFYGPKGIGFLYKKKGLKLNPLIIGGGQETSLRAGTENISGIAGLGEAAKQISKKLNERINHLSELESFFVSKINNQFPNAIYNGHPKHHVPGLISLSFPGHPSEIVLAKLDRKGIELSSGSACGSGIIKPSPVLKQMGIPDEQNLSTLRVSFGRNNTKDEIEILVNELDNIING